MFQKYIQILKDGIDALSSLHGADASIFDYFTAVGYELALILLGILYLALIIIILTAPFAFVFFVKNTSFGATKRWKQYESLEHEIDDFSKNYAEKVKEAVCAKSRKAFDRSWDKLATFLKEKDITLDTSEENRNRAFAARNDEDVSIFADTLPEIALTLGITSSVTRYQEIHSDDNSVLIQYRKKLDELFKSEDDFECCQEWNGILEHVECISFVIGYLILLIPLILMFVG